MLGRISQGDDIVYAGNDLAACVEFALGVAAADCGNVTEHLGID